MATIDVVGERGVAAGIERLERGVFLILRKTLRDQLPHRLEIGHDQAGETPFPAQDFGQQTAVGGVGNAGDIVEAGHGGQRAGRESRLERRQVDLAQGDFGKFDGVVFHPAFDAAIAGEMFGTGEQGIFRTQILALEAANPRGGDPRAEPGVLAGAFHHPAPALVAGDVHHGRESPVQAKRAGFFGRSSGGAAAQFGIETRRLGERDGKGRLQPVDHVGGEDQRDAQARLLDRASLQFAIEGKVEPVEIARRQAAPRVGERFFARRLMRALRIDGGRRGRASEDRKLGGLLLQGHAAQQNSRYEGRGRAGARKRERAPPSPKPPSRPRRRAGTMVALRRNVSAEESNSCRRRSRKPSRLVGAVYEQIARWERCVGAVPQSGRRHWRT